MKLHIANTSGHADAPPGLMLSPDGRDWCSVDGGCAGGPIRPAAIVLTCSAQDRVSPLLDLRHGSPIELYATPSVFEHLTQTLPLLPVLQQYCGVCWHLLAVAGEQQSVDFTISQWPQWLFTALQMPDDEQGTTRHAGAIALSVREQPSGKQIVFLPFAPSNPARASSAWDNADCVVVCEASADCWAHVHALQAPRKVVLNRKAMSDSESRAARNAVRSGVELAHAGAVLEV
jgi:pyrroloquinoline quinone biosynthesis protein B